MKQVTTRRESIWTYTEEEDKGHTEFARERLLEGPRAVFHLPGWQQHAQTFFAQSRLGGRLRDPAACSLEKNAKSRAYQSQPSPFSYDQENKSPAYNGICWSQEVTLPPFKTHPRLSRQDREPCCSIPLWTEGKPRPLHSGFRSRALHKDVEFP